MSYTGAEALLLDAREQQNKELHPQLEPSFTVISGGGLDAEVRRGVSFVFVQKLGILMLAVILIACVGAARIALSIATVATMDATSQLESKVENFEKINSKLKIERSVNSSSTRIIRIATQNYGMVRADSIDHLKLISQVEEEPQASRKSQAQSKDKSSESSQKNAPVKDGTKPQAKHDSSWKPSDPSSDINVENAGSNAISLSELVG